MLAALVNVTSIDAAAPGAGWIVTTPAFWPPENVP